MGGGVGGGGCLQGHIASDKPPPPHLIAVSVFLSCYHEVLPVPVAARSKA